MSTQFELGLHKSFIVKLGQVGIKFNTEKTLNLQFYFTEQMRLSAIYWATTCLDLMGELKAFDRTEIIDFVLSCRHSNGGFSGHLGHDPHLLYTLSAIQILAIFDSLHLIDEQTVDCNLWILIKSYQKSAEQGWFILWRSMG